jgi:endonuclease YncB( thermonuclease family)
MGPWRASFAAILGAAALAAPAPAAEVITGRVVSVHDGDTLAVLDATKVQHKIRLSGIDAPELGQPFGQASRQNLARLAFKRDARADCPKRDRYGRAVCRVLVDGRDVSLEQLRDGMAWHFKRYEHEQPAHERELYGGTEDAARAQRNGLWRDREPVAPWAWRASTREKRR